MTACLADKPSVLQAFPDHADNADQEPARVSVLALVESERLLIQVTEQVKRLDADIRATDGPLEQRPEVFQPVGKEPDQTQYRVPPTRRLSKLERWANLDAMSKFGPTSGSPGACRQQDGATCIGRTGHG